MIGEKGWKEMNEQEQEEFLDDQIDWLDIVSLICTIAAIIFFGFLFFPR